MATIYPHADFDEIDGRGRPMAHYDIVCLHTMADSFANVDRFFHDEGYGGRGSHFGVAADGRLKQWRDLDFKGGANKDGNHRIVSIETADKGESFPDWVNPNVPPWTDAQLDVLIELVGWLCDQFDIPRELVADSRPQRRGVAYHRQGIPGNFDPPFTGLVEGGELWTVLPDGRGKVCPGNARIVQLRDVILPALHGTTELFPTLDREQQREILRLARKLDERDKRTFPEICGDGRLREVVVAGRALLGTSSEVPLGADTAPLMTGLVTGAILDGLRRPSPDRPDRGDLRGPFKDVFRAALARSADATDVTDATEDDG